MNWPAVQSILYIVAGVAVSGALGYAAARQSKRLFWLGLVSVLVFPAFLLGLFSIGMNNPLYLGIMLLVIVPWLLGGLVARRGHA